MFTVHVMGCFFSKFFGKPAGGGDKSQLVSTEAKKEYSWDKKPKVDPKNYTIENVVDSEVIREPNTVNGRQFIIQNCTRARILVLDHCSSVTIDDCNDCQIVLGPNTGSLFVRGSENMTLVALCGQFRARDCRNVTAFLLCSSQPSIEACTKFEFGCALMYYKGLDVQMGRSGLSLFNNQWNLIYDFTPVPSEGPNWQLIPASKIVQLMMTPIFERSIELELVLGERIRSVVPYTVGAEGNHKTGPVVENCFVAVANCNNQTCLAMEFITSLGHMENICLVQSTENKIEEDEARKIFPLAKHTNDSKLNVICMHFRGNNCCARCNQVLDDIVGKYGGDTKTMFYVSKKEDSKSLINSYFGRSR